MFLGIFKDVIKLLNKKVVPVYFWFFLYCFLSTMDTNIFVSSCSFLKVEVFGKDENTTLVLLFYVFYSLFTFYLSRIKNKNNYCTVLYCIILYQLVFKSNYEMNIE